MKKKRNLFAEMMQGVSDMATQREGKITLRKWEQDKAKSNTQVAILIRLVE